MGSSESKQPSNPAHNNELVVDGLSLISSTGPHYIGVDVGTGSARACVVNDKGELLGHALHDIQQWQSHPGYYEQSTADIWQAICKVVKGAMSQAGTRSQDVKSIAFAATCSLAVFTHDTNEAVDMSKTSVESSGPARNIILWMDRRAHEEAAFINSKKSELLKYLGGSISVLMELPKVLWLKNNTPKEVFTRHKFFDLNDALTYMATGRSNLACSASCKEETLPLGVDGTIKGWSREFLTEIGLGELAEDEFKRVGGVCEHGKYPPAGTYVGQLSQTAAKDLGLSTSVLVGTGVIDAYAGWVGTVGASFDGPSTFEDYPLKSRLSLVAGTSTCLIAAAKTPVFVKGVWGPYQDWILPGFWISSGGQAATGQLLQHMLEIHPSYEVALLSAKRAQLSIFDYLDKHLYKMCAAAKAPNIPHLARHLFFYGDLFGNRSPIADPLMTGSVVGLTADKSLDNLAITYYSVIEFLALQTHQIISLMNEGGHSITSIFMSGSQCKNKILVDTIATACQLPVITPQYENGAVAFGAALLAAKTSAAVNQDSKAGSEEDIWVTMQRLTRKGKYNPPLGNEGGRALLQVKYRVFLEQCDRQQHFRVMVDEVVGKDN